MRGGDVCRIGIALHTPHRGLIAQKTLDGFCDRLEIVGLVSLRNPSSPLLSSFYKIVICFPKISRTSYHVSLRDGHLTCKSIFKSLLHVLITLTVRFFQPVKIHFFRFSVGTCVSVIIVR